MPGQNSNFQPDATNLKEHLLWTKAHLITIMAIIGVGGAGLTRFYFIFPELRFSLEAMTLTALCIFADYMVIAGLLAAKDADPGYLIPTGEDVTRSGTSFDDIDNVVLCQKCSYPKGHIRINHCSRCNRCVEYMDHHCIFVDNCIAKGNLRYYYQFLAWSALSLAIGFLILLFNIYYRNTVTNYGVQGLWDAVMQSPTIVNLRYQLEYIDNNDMTVGAFDSYLIMVVVLMKGLIWSPGIITYWNLRDGTSEVLKLKVLAGTVELSKKDMLTFE